MYYLKHSAKKVLIMLLVLSGLILNMPSAFSQLPEPQCVCAECGRPCGSGHARNCSSYGGGGENPGGDKEYRDPFSAPIIAMPAGCIAGVFMGGHWYFKKMSGDYPTTVFLDDYINHQKIDNDKAFSAGAFLGGLPWLALYAVTGPIRHGVVAINKAVNTPSSPKPSKPLSDNEIANEYYNQGKIYETSGNLKLAEKYYKSAIKYNPDLDGYHSQLANVLYRQGKYEEAIELYIQSIALNSQDPVAYKKIADIYSHNLGQKGNAENWYRRALDIYPADDPTYSVVVGELIDTVNDIKKDDFNKRIAKQENLLDDGQYSEASQFAEKTLMVNQNSAKAWAIYGKASEKQGNYLKAKDAYSKAVDLDPSQKNKDNLTNALNQLKAEGQTNKGTTDLNNKDQQRSLSAKCFDAGGCTFTEDNSTTPVLIAPRATVQQLIDKAPPELQKDPKFIKLVEERKRIDEEIKNNSDESKGLWNLRMKNDSSPEKSGAIDVLIVNGQIENSKLEYKAALKDKEIDTFLDVSFTPSKNQSQPKGD